MGWDGQIAWDTTVSIELDRLEHVDCGPYFGDSTICPRDKAIIQVDRVYYIDPIEQPAIDVGEEFSVHFAYSARPATLLQDRKQICEGFDECPAFTNVYRNGQGEPICEDPNGDVFDCDAIYIEEKPNEIVQGYVVYHFPEGFPKLDSDIILPGITEGDRLRFRSTVAPEWYMEQFQLDSQIKDIEIYEVIS